MKKLKIVILMLVVGGLISSCNYSIICPTYSMKVDMQVDTGHKDNLEKPAKIKHVLF